MTNLRMVLLILFYVGLGTVARVAEFFGTEPAGVVETPSGKEIQR